MSDSNIHELTYDHLHGLCACTVKSDLYSEDRQALFRAADGTMMCEKHPGMEWPHDDCVGPGTPWVLDGKTVIMEAVTGAYPAPSLAPHEQTEDKQ